MIRSALIFILALQLVVTNFVSTAQAQFRSGGNYGGHHSGGGIASHYNSSGPSVTNNSTGAANNNNLFTTAEMLRAGSNNEVFGTGPLAFEGGVHSVTGRTELFNSLLGTSSGSPSWPSFPRMWAEQFYEDEEETSVFISPSIFGGSYNSTLDYRYAKKITLIMMASLDSDVNPNPNIKNLTINVPGSRMFTNKPGSPMRIIKPNLKSQVVAFCAYENSYRRFKNESWGLSLLSLLGYKKSSKQTHGLTNTVFSKFFVMPKDKTVDEVLHQYCINTFKEGIKQIVEEDFSLGVIEFQYLYNNKNVCRPNPKDDENGDHDCKDWFNKFNLIYTNPATPTRHVPRCLIDRDLVGRCKKRTRVHKPCPLYQDRKGNIFPAVVKHGLKKITGDNRDYPCDAGLKCQMVEEPSIQMGGLIYSPARAVCVPE